MVGALEQGRPPRRKLLGDVDCYCFPAVLCTAALLTSSPSLIFQAEHNFHFPETVFLFPVDHHHCGKVDIWHHCIGNGGIAFSFVAL